MINVCNLCFKKNDLSQKANNSYTRLQSDSLHYSVFIKTFSVTNRYYIHNKEN